MELTLEQVFGVGTIQTENQLTINLSSLSDVSEPQKILESIIKQLMSNLITKLEISDSYGLPLEVGLPDYPITGKVWGYYGVGNVIRLQVELNIDVTTN